MAKTNPETSSPGVCLLSPSILNEDTLAGNVTLGLSHPAAEVIIATGATQQSAPATELRDLRAVAKRLGKVFLVENDIGLARELDADGMVLGDRGEIGRARQALGDEAQIGVVCGLSRHRAMEAGESGADFVGLGGPGADREISWSVTEHIAWWSSIFQIPSVAFGAETSSDAEAFLAAGADFVALGDPFWNGNAMTAILDTLGAGAGTK